MISQFILNPKQGFFGMFCLNRLQRRVTASSTY